MSQSEFSNGLMSENGCDCHGVLVIWLVQQDFDSSICISIVYICANVHIYPEYTGRQRRSCVKLTGSDWRTESLSSK